MVAYSALTDLAAVESALDEFDRLGRAAFLEKYGFGEAREYFLVTDDGHYDSKAIFGVAWGYQHGTPLTSEEFVGGKNGAAGRLSQLGYDIEGLEPRGGRLSFDTFEAALNEFRPPVENITKIREYVMARDFAEFYIPASRPYIAMIAPGDERPSAWVHRGYIWFRNEDGTQGGIALPYNKLRDGGGSRMRRREESRRFCESCGMALPATGVCDYC